MKAEKSYYENPGKAVERDGCFAHVMALSLDPSTGYREGVVRCVLSREGNVFVKGYIDRSELHHVRKSGSGAFEIGERLAMNGEDEMIGSMLPEDIPRPRRGEGARVHERSGEEYGRRR